MEITWGTIALIVIATIVGWFWQDSLRVRDVANAAAIEACTRLGLQFLDGTVAFSRLRLVRDAGQLRIRRTYLFDYTAHSMDRLQGFVLLVGLRVESVGFARETPLPVRPSVVADTIDQTAADTAAADTKETGKIMNLDDWRRTRERQH